MNCFQLVKTVLDDLYSEIYEVEGNSTDAIIKRRLRYLSRRYEDLEDIAAGDIDYNDPATRFAYVYRYTTAHADIVFQHIRDLPILREAFDSNTFTVGCLGGGPGSDILGILKFMSIYGSPENLSKLRCTTCDKEQTWNETWYNIDSKIENSFDFSASFHFLQVDVTEGRSRTLAQKLSDVDLFTMIYFLSEVFIYREDARDFFEHLFALAKPGALLFFVDNSHQAFYEWFDEVAIANGMEIVSHRDYLPFQTGYDEEKTELEDYYEKFGSPRLKAQIVHRVYRKA